MVFAFHGGGGRPASLMRLSGLYETAAREGFAVVYPYGTGRRDGRLLTFNGGRCCGYASRRDVDDVAFVEAILDDLPDDVPMDPGRVYATGMSNGAILAYRVAAELSERFAAVAPVAGPMMTAIGEPERPVAVMHFHGTADRFAPFDGGEGVGLARSRFTSVDASVRAWVDANGCNADPRVEKLPDRADDGTRVVKKTWGGGRRGTEVVLITIENGGHTWPGRAPPRRKLGKATQDISANDLMGSFSRKHARDGEAGRDPDPDPTEPDGGS